MRVFVYRNLHRKCWSVKAMEGPNKGRVIAHEDYVQLRDATFKVSEAGRQRVLKERRKNVHAGVQGEWVQKPTEVHAPTRVRYCPYKGPTFIRENCTPIHNASVVDMVDGCVFVTKEENTNDISRT